MNIAMWHRKSKIVLLYLAIFMIVLTSFLQLILTPYRVFAKGSTSVEGDIGDGGPAIKAQINGPGDIAVDRQDNLYIVENAGNRLRRIDAKTGIITTVAGNGEECLGRDCIFPNGIFATNMMLGAPLGVAVDTDGNIFFTQITGQILKVDAITGRISTIVTEEGLGCKPGVPNVPCVGEFEDPDGIKVGPREDLFFTVSRDKVYEFSKTTGDIRLIAGGFFGFSGDGGPAIQAKLAFPMGIVVDSKGNVTIADYENCRIRRIDATTGIITTIAGTGKVASEGDGGSALQAALDYPDEMAEDSQGNVFFVEGAGKVRRIDTRSGLITTVAGNGRRGSGGDNGPAIEAELYNPSGVAIDSARNLYISDYVTNRVRRVDAKTGIITTFAGNGLPHTAIMEY